MENNAGSGALWGRRSPHADSRNPRPRARGPHADHSGPPVSSHRMARRRAKRCPAVEAWPVSRHGRMRPRRDRPCTRGSGPSSPMVQGRGHRRLGPARARVHGRPAGPSRRSNDRCPAADGGMAPGAWALERSMSCSGWTAWLQARGRSMRARCSASTPDRPRGRPRRTRLATACGAPDNSRTRCATDAEARPLVLPRFARSPDPARGPGGRYRGLLPLPPVCRANGPAVGDARPARALAGGGLQAR